MAERGIAVWRVSPKVSLDYAEIYDGVPSQHDGKDVEIVAELAALGKASVWDFVPNEWEERLARREIHREELMKPCSK